MKNKTAIALAIALIVVTLSTMLTAMPNAEQCVGENQDGRIYYDLTWTTGDDIGTTFSMIYTPSSSYGCSPIPYTPSQPKAARCKDSMNPASSCAALTPIYGYTFIGTVGPINHPVYGNICAVNFVFELKDHGC